MASLVNRCKLSKQTLRTNKQLNSDATTSELNSSQHKFVLFLILKETCV